jgi:hypothetical protein
MVEFPPGEPQEICAICREEFEHHDPEFAAGYANLVCEACDEQAVTRADERPKHGNEYLGKDSFVDDDSDTLTIRLDPHVGENPVFIEGQKCWRRYRFGGWITRRDDHDCDTLEEFHETHRDDM